VVPLKSCTSIGESTTPSPDALKSILLALFETDGDTKELPAGKDAPSKTRLPQDDPADPSDVKGKLIYKKLEAVIPAVDILFKPEKVIVI